MSGTDPRFGEYFLANVDYVVKTLRRLGVRPADCEDLAHELFLAVHRRFDEVDLGRPARPYLFGYARRFASAYRDSAYYKRQIALHPNAALVDPQPTGEDLLHRRAREELVHLALDTLEADRREVFVMFELDERSMNEIANELQLPLTTIVSRLRGARRDFAAACKRLSAVASHPHAVLSEAPRG